MERPSGQMATFRRIHDRMCRLTLGYKIVDCSVELVSMPLVHFVIGIKSKLFAQIFADCWCVGKVEISCKF